MRGSCTEGDLRFKIDWASLILGRKFTVFALFYFVKLRAISKYQPSGRGGAYIWRGDLTEGFCVTSLGGFYLERLIHGGSYFRNFTVTVLQSVPVNLAMCGSR